RVLTNTRRFVLIFAGCGLFAAGGFAPSVLAASKKSKEEDSSNKVTAVRFWSLGDTTRVAVEVSGTFQFKSERLIDPDRLFFDIRDSKPALESAKSEKATTVIPVGDALLKQIRVAETQKGVTRVVLDLTQPAAMTASQLSSPARLMVELRRK